MLSAFPQEPVGAGAVWAIGQPSLPGPVWEVVTVTIDRSDGQRYLLHTAATYQPWQEWLDWQQAAQEDGGIGPPELRGLEGSSTGELRGSLGSISPDHASRSRGVTAIADLPGGGGTVQSTMQSTDRLEPN